MEITPKKLEKNCNIPVNYSRLTLAEMDWTIYDDQTIEEAITGIDESLRSGEFSEYPVFLVIDGRFGNGKTRTAAHLVTAAYHGFVANHRVRAESTRPYFIRASAAARVRFDQDNGIWAYLFDSCFLVLDDINRIAGYKGETDFIEEVIEHRHQKGRSTVITMNTSLDNVGQRLSSFLSEFEHLDYAAAPDQRRSN